jgi:hypothetical protein
VKLDLLLFGEDVVSKEQSIVGLETNNTEWAVAVQEARVVG